MKTFAAMMCLLSIAIMLWYIGHINHDSNTEWLAIGWYIGILMGLVSFSGKP